ncbi:MAG: alpha/beta fold hydrolase [Proteobacteria bacterium]|nr:alpha/beta fold hydrolase [Pseudomonadota bacterium]
MSMMDSMEHGVLRLVAQDAKKARKVIADLGVPTTETDVLLTKLPNRPGAFADVVGRLAQAHINVNYAYCTTGAANGKTIGIFKIADVKKAMKVLAERKPRRKTAAPVLFVPSLVNRYYILDLSRRRSLMRYLAGNGVRPLLMDWGHPGPAEHGYDLTDYTAGRLEAALDAATEACGGAVTVAGYCMGGLLALALAQRRPRQVRALALLATPWDFHATEDNTPDAHARLLDALAAPLDGLLAALGELPIDALQALFTWSDPTMVANKFRALAGRDPAGPGAEDFVALEDWLNDGVALTASVARECLIGWYGENRPARGQWRIAGETVRPESLDLPSLLAIPRRDRIVPPASALALAEAMPNAVRLTPPAGHIGMVIGRSAREGLWKPLESWLKSV